MYADGWMDGRTSISIRDEIVYAAPCRKRLGESHVDLWPQCRPSTLCQVRFCKATQEAREAMSADIVRELREKFGEEKAEEIHPNQDLSDLSDDRRRYEALPVPS